MATFPDKIKGDNAIDDRGKLSFINDFNPVELGIKRFYTVENHFSSGMRAWHGHKKEEKYVYVPSGWAKFVLINMETEYRFNFVLHEDKPEILHIPAGYYNGFLTQTKDTKVIFFSTATLEESADDDFRKEWTDEEWDMFESKVR